MSPTVEAALAFARSLRNKNTYRPSQLLSDNDKTNISINLPIKGHCTPTKRCLQDCYGKSGHFRYGNTQKKLSFLSKYLEGKNIDDLIAECMPYQGVRLNGVGDLLPTHLPQIFSLAEACPQTTFWGMTRKIDIASQVNGTLNNLSLLVSVDVTSPKSVWNYDGILCYGPRRPEDDVPDDKRIITIFPRHHAGKVIGNIPHDKRDCPAVRHTIKGCIFCQRCWRI